MVTRFVLTVVLSLAFGSVFAEDLWVRPNGTFTCSGDCRGASYGDAFNGASTILWGDGAGRLGAGDTLRVCGDFDRTTENAVFILSVNASGEKGRPIVIDGACSSVNPSYPDGRIWGARRIDKSAWSPTGDGTYVTPWIWQHEYAAEGSMANEKLLITANSRDENARTLGSTYVDTSARLLYYRPSTGLETVWANWTSAIDIQGNDFITIRNLVLRGAGTGENGVIRLTGNKAYGRATGISIIDSDIAFSGMQLIECYDGCDDLLIEGNKLHHAPTATYLCRGPVSCARVTMRDNDVYSGRDIANVYAVGYADRHALGGQSINNSLFEGNHIHDWAGEGIGIWVGPNKDGSNNVVRFNRIERISDTDNANVHNGISLSGSNEANKPELTQGWKIYGNVIRDLSGGKGPHDEGAAIRIKAPAGTSIVPAEVFNNTIVNVRIGVFVRENSTVEGLAARVFNNLIVIPDAGGEFVRVDPAGYGANFDLRFDNNLYFGAARFNHRTAFGSTLADWQRLLGGCARADNDCSAMSRDPLLASDQSLQFGSPAIDAGRSLDSGVRYGLESNTTFPGPGLLDHSAHGLKWEVGAFVYEHSEARPSAPENVTVE